MKPAQNNQPTIVGTKEDTHTMMPTTTTAHAASGPQKEEEEVVSISRKRSAEVNDARGPPIKRATVDSKKSICEVCNSNITKSNWARHLKSPKHIKSLQQLKKPDHDNVMSDKGKTSKPQTARPQAPRTATQPVPSSQTSAYIPQFQRHSSPSQQPAPIPIHVKRSSIKPASSSDQPQQQLKIPGPICGTQVTARSMRQHQHVSKKCKNSFEVEETKSRYIKKYGTTEFDFTMKVNVIIQIESAISHMIDIAKEKANFKEGDKIFVVARHPDFRHDISTFLNLRSASSNAKEFMEHVERILSSNEAIDVTDIRWNVKVMNIPRGQARSKRIVNLSHDVRTKRCIVRIQNNNDNLCGARAVVTALTYYKDTILDRPISQREKTYIRKGRPLQTELSNKLCRRLGGVGAEGFTLEDFKKVERLLNVQIKIICCENMNSIIYEGPVADTVLYLFKNGDHFDVISSMAAFFGSSYYCTKCDTRYNNKKRRHRCKKSKVCYMCLLPAHGEQLLPELYCDNCNRYCYNIDCLANHGEVCRTEFKCATCHRIKKRGKEHSCKHYLCKNCGEVVEFGHLCYMQKKRQRGGHCGCVDCICSGGISRCSSDTHRCTFTEKYLFFDYEAMQESGVHEPNFIHVQDFHGDSWNFVDNASFCQWLLSDDHKAYTCIAHNAKEYDSHFILRYCVENTIKPKTIYKGTKLMELKIPSYNIRVIDSANFVAEPLSSFPKTFGLTELEKGYFPHLFNTAANQDYVGPIPDPQYYSPETMKPAAREAFLKWHAKKKVANYEYNFHRELEEYCKSDVDILRRGCLDLRKQFLEIADIDPFQYITIASVCMAIYRSKYLPEKTIALVKSEDHEGCYSKESIAWLSTVATEDNDKKKNIRHALNGGEIIICGAKVDGYCAKTKTVYQFHGCYWHGCEDCYDPTLLNQKTRHSMGDLNMRTRRRTQQLRDEGYKVVEMWECKWRTQYHRLRNILPEVVEPSLNPRNAFYGGRTDVCKLQVAGHRLRYIDVVSLYPTVMFSDLFPTGHPQKIVRPATTSYDRNNWFGLVYCRMLPPRGLYHPVLPYRTENKLLFPLCAKCAEEKMATSPCDHDEVERALIGTWTTMEIDKALQKGYHIVDLYEVWNFQRTSNGLFNGYVKDFMKLKLESSSWQNDYTTVEDYVRSVRESVVGIEMDSAKIEVNPGRRAVAKICLNSLWGKFGQRQNMDQTEFVTEALQFYNILLDTKLDKTNVMFLNNNIAQITYNKKAMITEDSNNINIFVAVFTTAHARLRLYNQLERLGESVVYYDTDSIVYIDDGNNTVVTGSMLGDWSDELGADDHIIDWVSTGPKSYAYETVKGKGNCKIKGFTLNFQNAQKLNLANMKDILWCEIEEAEIVYNQIRRDKLTKKLVNKAEKKRFKMNYDKRMIVKPEESNKENKSLYIVDTLPWGY